MDTIKNLIKTTRGGYERLNEQESKEELKNSLKTVENRKIDKKPINLKEMIKSKRENQPAVDKAESTRKPSDWAMSNIWA
tara:strand:- start:65 stop:304 length:240 start_codon:yes stop_codon:yes gene_type:complete